MMIFHTEKQVTGKIHCSLNLSEVYYNYGSTESTLTQALTQLCTHAHSHSNQLLTYQPHMSPNPIHQFYLHPMHPPTNSQHNRTSATKHSQHAVLHLSSICTRQSPNYHVSTHITIQMAYFIQCYRYSIGKRSY